MIKRPFSYFGSKHAIAHLYPTPKYGRIIEPFAGSAGYACLHSAERHVKLFDIDDNIISAWKYLIETDSKDVFRLPVDYKLVPQEARALVGFWLANGRATPADKPSSWMLSGDRPNAYWGQEAIWKLTIISNQVKHWTIEKKSFTDVDTAEPATWFIDPPYSSQGGRSYTHNSIIYTALAAWCSSLKGQVIVCEEEGADWLPFKPLGNFKCSPGRKKTRTREVYCVL